MVKHISGKELEELIQSSDKAVFCDFWANWCGPCRMLAPVFEEISNNIFLRKCHLPLHKGGR